MRRMLWLVALALVAAACAPSEAVRAARRGDAAALGKAIDPELRTGTLSDAEAAAIARAVAERDVAEAKGEEGVARLRELWPCASRLASALAQRSETHDAVGAEAAMALVEADALSEDDARKYVSDPDDGWRAVGARGLVRAKDAEARRRALVDASARVRRAAMRASAEARDPEDVAALFEAARVDPDLLARSTAVRAIARIDPAGSDAAVRLRDLWTTGDEALREDVALAYTSPHIVAAGGAEALRVLLAAGRGVGAVSAAGLVLRRGLLPSSAVFDDETRRSAVAVLLHAIEDEPRRERMLALATAPLTEPDLLAAVKKASRADADLEIEEAALARLLDVPAEKEAAIKALLPFANPANPPERFARSARLALAAAGERSVQAWIEADLRAPSPSTRLLAAGALASLRRAARAAPLLMDPDDRVRLGAACTLIRAAK